MLRAAALLAALSLLAAGCGGDAVVEVDGGYLPIPDVVGQSVDSAEQTLRDSLLKPVIADRPPAGADGCDVTAQRPGSDEFAEMDQPVHLQVSCRAEHSAASTSAPEDDPTQTFQAAYAAAFDAGCAVLFADVPDRLLFATNQPYRPADCRKLQPESAPVPDPPPADPDAAGRRQGRHDGCLALFEHVQVSGFGSGSVVVTRSNCPAE